MKRIEFLLPISKLEILKSLSKYKPKREKINHNIYEKNNTVRVGGTILKTSNFDKITIIVNDRQANEVINYIKKFTDQEIIISEVLEVIKRRSRMIPLQKNTLERVEKLYDDNEDRLEEIYGINSFTNFVNFCVLKSIEKVEYDLGRPEIYDTLRE